MRKYHRAYIDTETTGVDRNLHHVHQISVILADEKMNVLDKLNLAFAPISVGSASPEALEKTRMTISELQNRPMKAPEAHKKLTEFLGRFINKYDKTDKAHLMGFAVGFDADFLRKFFIDCGDNYFGSWFWTPPIDLMSVSGWLLGDGRGALPNFKLETVCRAAGISWDESRAHDAMYDVEKTFELDKYLRSNFTA